MNDEDLRKQIESLIRDEIQETINDYVDSKEESKESGVGFVPTEEKKSKGPSFKKEIDNIIKNYKKQKKSERSNLSHIKKLGLVDKNGRPLNG